MKQEWTRGTSTWSSTASSPGVSGDGSGRKSKRRKTSWTAEPCGAGTAVTGGAGTAVTGVVGTAGWHSAVSAGVTGVATGKIVKTRHVVTDVTDEYWYYRSRAYVYRV